MSLNSKNILLLQGPIGSFFAYLAEALSEAGAKTHRICLNRGDALFAFADQVDEYHGDTAGWRDYLSRYIRKNAIDIVIVYGDSRFYHRAAREVADQHDVRFFALEEGYVRPGYVTLEEFGNNANSRFPGRFRDDQLFGFEKPEPLKVRYTFGGQIWNAITYYVVKDWRFTGFKGYRHHRPGNWFTEMSAWIIAWFRRMKTRRLERGFVKRLRKTVEADRAPVFFVPLQVAVDSQIIYHSPFDSMHEFIEQVFQSFAGNAPADAILVLKHHPMDRGFHHYGRFIRSCAKKYGLSQRVHYVFEADLYALFEFVSGCVTVNSTVGMIALRERIPTIALGKAMFADAGLTYDGDLSAFWQNTERVDFEKVAGFEAAIVAETLVPGSFYGGRRKTARNIIERLSALVGHSVS